MFEIKPMDNANLLLDVLAFDEAMQASYIQQADLVNEATLESYALMQEERAAQALELERFKRANRIDVGFC